MFFIFFIIDSDAKIRNIANYKNCNLSLFFNFLVNQSVFAPIYSNYLKDN